MGNVSWETARFLRLRKTEGDFSKETEDKGEFLDRRSGLKEYWKIGGKDRCSYKKVCRYGMEEFP